MNEKINILRIIRLLDRKILLMILVGVLFTSGVQILFVAPSKSALNVAKLENETLIADTTDLEKRVDAVVSGGMDSIDGIANGIKGFEKALAESVDDLAFTESVYLLAGNSVALESVTKIETGNTGNEGVQYVEYSLRGSAPYGVLKSWLKEIVFSGNNIVTVKKIRVAPNSKSKQNSNDDLAAQTGLEDSATVTFDAIMLVWFDSTEPLLDKATDSEATDAAIDTPVVDGVTQTGEATNPEVNTLNPEAKPTENQNPGNQPNANTGTGQ
jgi:hypothetical protein